MSNASVHVKKLSQFLAKSHRNSNVSFSVVGHRRGNIMFSENGKAMWLRLFCMSVVIGTISTLYPEEDNEAGLVEVRPTPSLAHYIKEFELSNMTEVGGNSSNLHDFIFGVRGPHDQLLLRTTIYRRPRIWSRYITREITFPPLRATFKVTISQVKAHDKGRNGTGGFVKITGGGIGKGNVTLLFSSHENLPIHFALEIFGTRN